MEELEENPEMRQNINIFRDPKNQVPIDSNDMDPNFPQVSLEEMLEDLVIDDSKMISVDE